MQTARVAIFRRDTPSLTDLAWPRSARSHRDRCTRSNNDTCCLLFSVTLILLSPDTAGWQSNLPPKLGSKAHLEPRGEWLDSAVRIRPDSTTATQCPTRSEKLSRERRQSFVMKDSSRIENKATGTSSDKWSMERELFLRDLVSGEGPQMAIFTERRRTSWKSFMWPRPCSASRLKPDRRSS
jgi:hypothetical protein